MRIINNVSLRTGVGFDQYLEPHQWKADRESIGGRDAPARGFSISALVRLFAYAKEDDS